MTKSSKPMTMADAARYLRGRAYFRTVREATAFLRQVRDSRLGTGDRETFSVNYTPHRRFVVMENEPGEFGDDSMTRPVTETETETEAGIVMLRFPGFPPVQGVGPVITAIEAEPESVRAGERRAWTDSEIPDGALDRALAPERPSWDMWAHDRNGKYEHPGEKWWVELHGLPDPVVPVTVTEVAGDAPDATHWGWIDSKSSTSRLAGVPCMIWASKAAFGAQFPYGPAAEVAAGKGQVVRLRITARKIPPA